MNNAYTHVFLVFTLPPYPQRSNHVLVDVCGWLVTCHAS